MILQTQQLVVCTDEKAKKPSFYGLFKTHEDMLIFSFVQWLYQNGDVKEAPTQIQVCWQNMEARCLLTGWPQINLQSVL